MRKHPLWEKLKPWILLSTYILILLAVLLNFKTVSEHLFWIISLFNPLLYGIAIAYVLNQPLKHIENFLKKHLNKKNFIYRKARGISMILTLLLAAIILTLIFVIVIPRIFASVGTLVNNVTVLVRGLVNNMNEILAYFNIDLNLIDLKQVETFLNMPWNEIVNNAISIAQKWLSSSASGIVSTTVAFGNTFATWFAGFMFSLYLLASKETLIRQLKKVLVVAFKEKGAKRCVEIGRKANDIFSGFIGGQLMEACILGVLYYIGMTLLQMPFAELISSIIAIASLVPVFGAMFGMMIGAVLIFTINPLQALVFIIFYQVLQEIENNLIYPRVVGSSVGLPGLWTLLSIFVFGGLFGVFGMLTAVPTTALIYNLFVEYVNSRLKEMDVIVDEEIHSTTESV